MIEKDGSDDQRAARALVVRSRYRFERLRRDAVAYALVERLARLRRVSLRDVLQGSRGTGTAALTRQIAMYLVHVVLSRPQDVVGLLFDRERTTVSHACALIEALRDSDPVVDAEIARLEAEGWGGMQIGPSEMRHVA